MIFTISTGLMDFFHQPFPGAFVSPFAVLHLRLFLGINAVGILSACLGALGKLVNLEQKANLDSERC